MIIKNVVNRDIELDIKGYASTCDSQTITLIAGGETDIIGMEILPTKDYKCIESQVDIVARTPLQDIVESAPEASNKMIYTNEGEPTGEFVGDVQSDGGVTPDEDEADQVYGGVQEEDISTPSFICPICQAEFASSRGLSSHMTRTHSEEVNVDNI